MSEHKRPRDAGVVSVSVQERAGEPEYGMRRCRQRLAAAFGDVVYDLTTVNVLRDGDSWLVRCTGQPAGAGPPVTHEEGS